MSPRRFEGWEPRTVTRVLEHDGQGRPVRWETIPAEPEWNDRQRALVMALQLWEASLCRRCGEHLGRATDPDTDGEDPHAHWAWEPEAPTECLSCRALVKSEQDWDTEENRKKGLDRWLIHTTRLVPKKPRLPRR